MILSILRLLAAIVLAFLAGKGYFQMETALYFGMADCGNDSGAPCPFFNQSGSFGSRLVPKHRTYSGMCGRPDDRNRIGMAETEAIRPFHHHYHSYPIPGDISSGIAGIWSGLLFLRYSAVSGLPFRRHCAGHRPGAGAVHCKRVQNQRAGHLDANSNGGAGRHRRLHCIFQHSGYRSWKSVRRGFARLYDCPGRAAAAGNRRDYRTAGRLRIKEGAQYFGNPGAADPHAS